MFAIQDCSVIEVLLILKSLIKNNVILIMLLFSEY